MRRPTTTSGLPALLLLLALVVLLAPGVDAKANGLGRTLACGQRAAKERASGLLQSQAGVSDQQGHVAGRQAAMQRLASLRLRARALIEGQGQAQSALQAGAAATLSAVISLPNKVNRRGAGGKAGRAGGKAGAAAANGGQSGRKAGGAAGNGGQSGRKAGDASGNGGQSGRKAGDSLLPVSPIIGSAPPDDSNVFALSGVPRRWPVRVYLRNQGTAATCWAHSAISLLELRAQMSLSKNELPTWYSVDQVVKCVKNDGADGGSPLDALEFIINSELMTDADVRAGKQITCNKINWSKRNNNSGRYTALLAYQPCINPGENCARMADYEWQMNNEFMLTPMLAYVDASQWDSYAPKFNVADVASYALGTAADYSGVVFPTAKCSMDPAKGDHLVILLGTVTCPKTKQKYWRVYNSWGKEWGVNGYIYLPFEQNACGLANYPVGLALMGGGDTFARPILMLPKTMSQQATAASAEYKKRDDVGGLSGGLELYTYRMASANK